MPSRSPTWPARPAAARAPRWAHERASASESSARRDATQPERQRGEGRGMSERQRANHRHVVTPPNPSVSEGRIAVALAAVLAVCAGCSTGDDATVYGGSFTFVSPGGKTELSYPVAERKTVGTLSGPNLDGTGTVSVADYPNDVVVLNFWGSWCGPCRGEADDLNSAAGDLKAAGVQFVGINVKDSQSAGADFLASKQVGYPSIFDPDR